MRLFVDDVVKPFEAEGMPPERWPEIVQAIERLRPMSAQVVLSVYRQTMSDEVDREAPKVFERLTKGQGPVKRPDRLAGLSEALGARPPKGLAVLPPAALEELELAVREARARQGDALEASLATSLRRGPATAASRCCAR